MPTTFERIDALDGAVSPAIAPLRRMFEEALRFLSLNLSTATIDEAIEARSAAPILESSVWIEVQEMLFEAFEGNGPILKVLKSAYAKGLTETPLKGLEMDISALDDVAATWLEKNGARLVTQVVDSTKLAIRELVEDAFRQPKNLRETARLMLDLKQLGITPQQKRSLLKHGTKLTKKVVDGKLSKRQRLSLMKKRYAKLRRARARMIAQTEAYNAGNAARRQLWETAVRNGDLDENEYEVEWVTRVVNVCPRCEALRGKKARILLGVFISDPVASGSFSGRVISTTRPTVHPRCYCGLRLVRIEVSVVPAVIAIAA